MKEKPTNWQLKPFTSGLKPDHLDQIILPAQQRINRPRSDLKKLFPVRQRGLKEFSCSMKEWQKSLCRTRIAHDSCDVEHAGIETMKGGEDFTNS